MNESDLFLRVSHGLTGCGELSATLSDSYFARLTSTESERRELSELLATFGDLVQHGASDGEAAAKLTGGSTATLVRRILVLWYTGAVLDANDKLNYDERDPTPWFAALMWRAMGAHPPGLSGGYFGYWRYPPEE